MLLEGMDEHPAVLEANCSDTGLKLVKENPDLDLVVLDINLPRVSGFDVLKILSAGYSDLPIMILTASESREDMVRCFEYGARAYVPKSSGSNVLTGVIRLVLAGGTYAPSAITMGAKPDQWQPKVRSQSELLGSLTYRQREVLSHLRDGSSNKVIAKRLGITESTVKVHMSGILKALGLRSRLEAALVAEKLDKDSSSSRS